MLGILGVIILALLSSKDKKELFDAIKFAI
jgi:hypothetical protein